MNRYVHMYINYTCCTICACVKLLMFSVSLIPLTQLAGTFNQVLSSPTSPEAAGQYSLSPSSETEQERMRSASTWHWAHHRMEGAMTQWFGPGPHLEHLDGFRILVCWWTKVVHAWASRLEHGPWVLVDLVENEQSQHALAGTKAQMPVGVNFCIYFYTVHCSTCEYKKRSVYCCRAASEARLMIAS